MIRATTPRTANIAPIRELPAHLSQAAGHGVRIATVWQSLAQARERYGNATDAILGNSTAKLYLGPVTDSTTRRHITDLLGEHSQPTTTQTTDAGHRRSTSTSLSLRAKADASTLQQLGRDRALLVEGHNIPAVIRLTPWWKPTDLRRRAQARV